MKDYLERLQSPNGDVSVIITEKKGVLYYAIERGGKPRFKKAVMGVGVGTSDLEYENFACDNAILSIEKKEIRDRAYVVYGRRENHVENCNEYILNVKHKNCLYQIQFRVYDCGAAFRYSFNEQSGNFVHKEYTEYLLPQKCTVYASCGCRHPACNTALNGHDAVCYECTYAEYNPKNKISPNEYVRKKDTISNPDHFNYVLFPMAIKFADGSFGAITESCVSNYYGSTLRPYGNYRFGLNTAQGEEQFKVFKTEGNVITPWRVFALANDLNELYNNDIVYSVVDKADKDFSFVKPGRAAWHWHAEMMQGKSLSTEMMEEFTDAAAKMGFEYNVIDAGWQKMVKTVKDKQIKSDKVLAVLSKRGKPYGVGQIVWSGFISNNLNPDCFEEKADAEYSVKEMLDICHKVGAAGVKVDFFRAENNMYAGVDMYERIADYCADRKMVCNFHGAAKPTGLSARYPNELSREGIKGMENFFYNPESYPDIAYAFSTLTFVRGLAGHGDWTPFVQDGIGLASIVLTDSPINVISATVKDLLENKAKDFIKSIPSSFDKTTVLPDSKFGEYVFMCKEKSGTYFFASMNNRKKAYCQTLELKSYMKKGVYLMELWFDSPEGLRSERRLLQEKDCVNVEVPPHRGFAARFSKLMPSYFGGEVLEPLNFYTYNGEDIYYTTDGSDPKTSDSRVQYTQSIVITHSCLIRACAEKDGVVTAETSYKYNVME